MACQESISGGGVPTGGRRGISCKQCLISAVICAEAGSGKELRIRAEFNDGTLICPLVSGADEAVSVEENGKQVIICKKNGQVLMESNREMRLPYNTERIFNLIPGLQALRVQINPQAGWAEVGIRVESGEEDGL